MVSSSSRQSPNRLDNISHLYSLDLQYSNLSLNPAIWSRGTRAGLIRPQNKPYNVDPVFSRTSGRVYPGLSGRSLYLISNEKKNRTNSAQDRFTALFRPRFFLVLISLFYHDDFAQSITVVMSSVHTSYRVVLPFVLSFWFRDIIINIPFPLECDSYNKHALQMRRQHQFLPKGSFTCVQI